MIQISKLSKAFADRTLLREVTWQISDRERVGLAGPNGAGKTTLLRMLAGVEEPDAGTVTKPSGLTVGYLPQDGLTHEGRTLFDEVSTALQATIDLKQELRELEERLADPAEPDEEHGRLLDRYSDAQEAFRLLDGYSLELKVATVLQGLGFPPDDFQQPTETFSGGWQMRIALARLLLERPGLLLLDEPTNHLDLDARNWLETYLSDYPRAVIVVSHDRFFLDAVVTRITEISLSTLTDYSGSYSHYLTARDERIERLREEKRRQDEEVARIRQFINRFRYQATKAAQVQSRVKMLEKIVPIEVPPARKRVHFTFPDCPKSGRMVLELRGVSKRYGDKEVLAGVDLHIERSDRIALIGPNGVGKSTLMRLLVGAEAPDTGERVEGYRMIAQYFAQDEASRLDPGLTVYETLASGSPVHMVPAIRNILGGFLFSGDDVYKRAGVLSGGERTRLAVARMLLRPANTLLLDEPTNHLDIDSKDVLLEALADFDGTLIFVSHDRYFVDRLATKVLNIVHGGASLYPGTYEEFRWRADHPPTQASAQPAGDTGQRRRSAGPARTRPARPPKEKDRDAKKVRQAETSRRRKATEALRARIAKLEQRIAQHEQTVKQLEATMSEPAFYDDRAAAQPTIDRHQAAMWEVGRLMAEWEELQRVADETPEITES
jgi:ATP-binding cassette subfamily F protein 3